MTRVGGDLSSQGRKLLTSHVRLPSAQSSGRIIYMELSVGVNVLFMIKDSLPAEAYPSSRPPKPLLR